MTTDGGERWWLDPDAPDPWPGIPTPYLSSPAFAVRVLRLITRLQRRGEHAEAVVQAVRSECMDLAGDLFPPRSEVDGDDD